MLGGSLSHRRNDHGFESEQVGASPNQLATILLDGFDDAPLGGTPRAESRDERPVLAAQDQDVRIRPVEVVVERGKRRFLYP
jgi:hypothetical protein